ncbi:MAG: hypothetical protein KC560_20565, partial [Myxococcales bacterium]|nr:hypothetical protein [Myxococcales bacterium]
DGHVAARVGAIARVEAAGAEDALGAFVVDAAACGLERRLRRTFDRTRRIASLAFDGVAATPLATPGADGPALERALDVATSILAAEMLGGSEHVLEASVAWARERRQFGRAIGSFQAVKHKAADVWIALEASRSLVDRAVECAALDEPGLALDASAAKAFLSEAYPHAARENVQIHGGIGFTWEHDAHLYLRRATSTATLLGDARWHRARVAALALAR